VATRIVQASGEAGTLEAMIGHRHDDDDELLELPGGSLEDGGAIGVDDSDALIDLEIDAGAEDVGLDTESLGGALLDDELEAALDAEPEEGLAIDDIPLDLDDDLDEAGEDERWTDESEGSSFGFDDEIEDDPLAEVDDGGLEGVDDPLIAALENDGELPALDGEDDAELDDDSELAALVLELDPH